MLVVSLALSVVWTPHSPLADLLALSGVRRFGSNYASMRIWGSISFLCANLVGGIILSLDKPAGGAGDHFGRLGRRLARRCCSRRAWASRGVPRRFRRPTCSIGAEAVQPLFPVVRRGAGVINASHGFLFGFVSIYWKSIGISDTLIGLLWALAVVVEVCMFMVFTRLFGSVSGDDRADDLPALPRSCAGSPFR